jgi:CheY-like chemotaxis protein
MHGGAIGFDSNSGSGSTFSFYVKGRKSQASPVGASPSEVVASSSSNLQSSTSFFSKRLASEALEDANTKPLRRYSVHNKDTDFLHVLIVEDNLVNQRVLSKQLRNLGMKVAVANHGGEALDYLRSTKFCSVDGTTGEDLSLILMDWEMPVMDGLSCVRNIRQLQKKGEIQGHVPVIAVTANVRSEQMKAAFDAGMDDVVSKPFRIPELIKRMHKLVNSIED